MESEIISSGFIIKEVPQSPLSTSVTRPAPKESAAVPAITAAPAFSPIITAACPKSPLCADFFVRTGSFISSFSRRKASGSAHELNFSEEIPRSAAEIFPQKSFASSVKRAVFNAPIVTVTSAQKASFFPCPAQAAAPLRSIPLGMSQAILYALHSFAALRIFSAVSLREP